MNLFKYIKYRKTLVAGFVLKTAEVVLELLLPILMAILMDEGLKKSDLGIGVKYSLIIVAFAIMGYLTTLYSQYAAAKVSLDYAKNLRSAIFDHVTDISLKDSGVYSSSSLLNRMNMDVNNLQNSLAMTVRVASRAPVLMVGSIISLFLLSPKIALVLIIGLPVLIGILIVIMYYSIYLFKDFQRGNDSLASVVSDNVEGVRMIRAFAKSKHEENRFERRNNALSDIMIKLGRITSLSNPVTMLILNVLLVVMIYFGINDINNSLMTDSQLLQIINYVTQLSFSIIGVMNLILLYTKASTSKVRIKELLTTKDSITNSEDKILLEDEDLKIEFKDVIFTYDDNNHPVLKNFNVTINPGETLGVVGLTGSGKTTFVDLLMRFYDVTSGEILINNINIKQYDIKSLREKIAYASQKPELLSSDVMTNITMGKDLKDEQIEKAIEVSQSQFVYDKENGLSALVNRGGSNFSGGQRQRIALARALAKDSPLLILDDIFSALDYVTDYNIRKALESNKQTKIFISQRLSSLYNADNIIVISDSEIRASGTHEELLSSSPLYKNLHDTQVLGGLKLWLKY